MRTIDLAIRNPSGLHARPAALFVRTAAGFRSKLTLQNLDTGSAPVDAKSIIALMGSGVSRGHTIRVTAEGEDEDAAIEALDALVASGVGESLEA